MDNFDSELTDLTHIFKFQRTFLKMMAQWPLTSPDSPKIVKMLAKCYGMFMIFLPLHLSLLHMKSVYDLWGQSLDDISDFITSTIILSFCCFATVFFTIYSRKLERLVAFMTINFRSRSARGLTYISIDQSYKKAKRYAYYWESACLFGTILWALYPLLTQERALPLRCWYPFDEKQPIVYETLYALQFFAQVQIGLAFANGSAVYFVLIILICGQFDILFCSFKNITNTAAYLDGGNFKKLRALQQKLINRDDEVNQYYCSSEKLENLEIKQTEDRNLRSTSYNATLTMVIKECVIHHRIILSVCLAMEDFFNPYCLIKSLQVTMEICFLLFLAVNQETTSILRNINLLQYLSLASTELLIFTYFGETLRIHSLRAGESLMRSSWVNQSVAIRKDILIILPNALRAVTLTSGKFYPMDIQRFKSVIASAFSFFTLLQHMQDKTNF